MNLNEKDVADILKRENAYCYITINIESDDLVMDLWKQSSDFGEFKEELLKHDYYDFKTWEGKSMFAYFSKKDKKHRQRILDCFDNRCFDVNSKKGRLIIRNSKKYTDWIKCNEEPSYHNGEIKVAVFEKGEIDRDYFFDMMRGLSGTGFLKGKTDICDCNENIIKSIEGTYMTFLYQDIVAFVEV